MNWEKNCMRSWWASLAASIYSCNLLVRLSFELFWVLLSVSSIEVCCPIHCFMLAIADVPDSPCCQSFCRAVHFSIILVLPKSFFKKYFWVLYLSLCVEPIIPKLEDRINKNLFTKYYYRHKAWSVISLSHSEVQGSRSDVTLVWQCPKSVLYLP